MTQYPPDICKPVREIGGSLDRIAQDVLTHPPVSKHMCLHLFNEDAGESDAVGKSTESISYFLICNHGEVVFNLFLQGSGPFSLYIRAPLPLMPHLFL